MNLKRYYLVFILIVCKISSIFGQDVTLYQQYNGRFDFTFIGNTLNPEENSFQTFPTIFTSSSASLSLSATDEIESAYLYWAGSGTGDFEVKLNDIPLTADRTFAYQLNNFGIILDYFSAFKNVTELVQQAGNVNYTLSELDVTEFIDIHFERKTNFAGWAIVIIYKNELLPLNQINIYDGFQAVPDEININLNLLNVIDNAGAKIGFLAWEGDVGIEVEETLSINGTPIENPPLNPVENAFNGTNSITGSNTLYNMDLDVYNIEGNIDIGDTSAQIKLQSGQDVVLINAIVTKLNSQLPDATIVINTTQNECKSRIVIVDFTVFNLNCTNPLPAGTPIAIYVNGQFIQFTETINSIPIDGSVSEQISLVIPDGIPNSFELQFIVDDSGTGSGIVTEIVETNNSFSTEVSFLLLPEFNPVPNLISCNVGLTKGTFDFSTYDDLIKINTNDTVHFYENQEDAEDNLNQIITTSNYTALTTPKEIFVRVEDENGCYSLTSFLLTVRNCPPVVYNYVSADNDTFNDDFFIEGLRDIFVNFKIEIYNRWGMLVWKGNNTTSNWNGYIKTGIGNTNAADGTYFYILHLNDIDYPRPLTGFVFLKN